MKYKIDVLKMGEAKVPGPEVYWMSQWESWETLTFWMVLMRGGGKTCIINTGPPKDLSDLNNAWEEAIDERSQMVSKNSERPEKALHSLGVDPLDVDFVLITPLQAYATGNISLFKNAKICISRRGWIEDFHAPHYHMHIPRKLRIPNESLHYLDIEAPDKLRLLEDTDEVLPGLTAQWVGVHHRSSVAYKVQTEHGLMVISDCFFKYNNIEEMRPLGIMENLEECMNAYEWISEEADILLPLYDPNVPRRLKDVMN